MENSVWLLYLPFSLKLGKIIFDTIWTRASISNKMNTSWERERMCKYITSTFDQLIRDYR